MDDLHLSEALQRYFNDLFICCDDDNNGNASLTKTIDLIKSGNIPEDIINQISVLCNWTDKSSIISKREFFIILKLVAAYQANIPLNNDLINLNIDLPLPKFSWYIIDQNLTDLNDDSQSDLIELQEQTDSLTLGDGNNTDSEIDTDTISIIRNDSSNDNVLSHASDSPTPTNSVQDRSWAAIGSAWHGLVSEEQRQLLGTEEESSDKHSSEDDTEIANEVWIINKEQRDYYTKQFLLLQPDINALLPGPTARLFFEKSRLPVYELKKIWQLADVTKDGALSLQEFNTAMHLVVLRRNNIDLPDTLPSSLLTGNNTPLSDSPDNEPILSPQTKENAKEWTKFVDSPTNSISSPGPKPVNFDFQKIVIDKDSKILHPIALRLTPETSNKINFQHQHQHPQQQDQEQDHKSIDNIDHSGCDSPKKILEFNNSFSCNNNNNNNNMSAIQRPQAKKINLPGHGAILPPPPPPPPPMPSSLPTATVGTTTTLTTTLTTTTPTTTIIMTNSSTNCNIDDGPFSLPTLPPSKKEKLPPPPPPPPRPFQTHGRSSSLDLNHLNKPPLIPPRISPSIHTTASKKCLINQKSEGDKCEFIANFDDINEIKKNYNSNNKNNNNNNNNSDNNNDNNVTEYDNSSSDSSTSSNKRVIHHKLRKPGILGEFSFYDTGDAFETFIETYGPFKLYNPQKCTSSIENFDSDNSKMDDKTKKELIDAKKLEKWELYKSLKEENAQLLEICEVSIQSLFQVIEEKQKLQIKLEKLQNQLEKNQQNNN